MENKCFHCGGPAVHYFIGAGRWCCEDNAVKCPAIKEKKRLAILEKNKDSPAGKARTSIANGTAKCVYCGESANFIINANKTCCKEKAYLCPEHSKFIGRSIKKGYEENPERCINMSKAMKKAQNREDVKAKKSNSMIELHRGNCEPCVEFQTKFKEGMDQRNARNHLKAYEFLISVDFKEEDIPDDMKDRASMVNRIKANKSFMSKFNE